MKPDFLPTRSLEQVVTTEQLALRPHREPDRAAIDAAVMALTRRVAESPNEVLQMLAETTLELCNAHTVGISVLERDGDVEAFKWRGLAGRLAQARGLGMPRSPSPCGMVLDQSANLLMSYPELHFEFPGLVDPPIIEVLLTPFFHDGAPVGTIWIVAHDHQRKFDSADLYAITELGLFASQTYSLLLSLGYFQPGSDPKHVSVPLPSELSGKHRSLH
jgi:hypothetical protein